MLYPAIDEEMKGSRMSYPPHFLKNNYRSTKQLNVQEIYFSKMGKNESKRTLR